MPSDGRETGDSTQDNESNIGRRPKQGSDPNESGNSSEIQIPASGPIIPVTMTMIAIRIRPATPKKAAQSNQNVDPDQGSSPSED